MSLSLVFLNSKVLFCLCVTLFQLHFTFSASKPSGLTLRAFVDDSPGSPLYRIENLTRAERIGKLIKITNARANYLNRISNPNSSVALPDNIPVPVYREGLFYAVQLAIGSPGQIVKLLMDTGSGFTWTQCLTCTTCFPQRLPRFNPRISETYSTLPCNHPICLQGGDYKCVRNVCRYTVRYGGGSITKGPGSVDRFHFFRDPQYVQSYPFVFGCSKDSQNMYFQGSDISGIFGLDLSMESITYQLSNVIGNMFSYCMAPFEDAIPRPLALRFGEDVPQLSHVGSTLFLHSAYNKFFNLELLDISVAHYKIGFPEHTFQERGPGSGGCFIDSGALYSQIDALTPSPEENAFEQVLQVFEAYYGSRGLTKRGFDPDGFELCFDHPPSYDDFASLTFHFNGADYRVDGKYMRIMYQGYFCVALARGNFGTIIGAWQQQNKRIIHNGMSGALQFADENCIDDII